MGSRVRRRPGVVQRAAIFACEAAASAAVAPGATADEDPWLCNSYVSGQQCYAGTGYRSYIQITNTMGGPVYEVCAKGVTAHGNIRTGSGCNNNASGRVSCYDSGSPNHASYIYWDGTGGPASVSGRARTPSSRTYC